MSYPEHLPVHDTSGKQFNSASLSKKNFICLVLIAALASSCVSSQKLLERGEYDRAIDKAAEKLQKRPDDSKEVGVLKEAYFLANIFDNERITYLKLEGREDNWIDIHRIYEQLDTRQYVVRRLPQQVREQFEFVNYNEKIVKAKSEAAHVSYDRGVELLNRGDRLSARDAYNEFRRIQEHYPRFRDVESKLNESLFLGINNVLFEVENNSDEILPQQYEAEVRRIALKDLNTGWLNFDTHEDPDLLYDYYVVLNIKGISVSPERLEMNRFVETREIEDGERSKMDEDGNVMKDPDGNDIKVPNLVTVSAQVVESIQRKSAVVSGSIDTYDLRTDQLVKTDNLSVEFLFEHHSAIAIGNRRALSEETASKTGQRPVSFPPDDALLLDSVDLLKERSRQMLAAHRHMLQY